MLLCDDCGFNEFKVVLDKVVFDIVSAEDESLDVTCRMIVEGISEYGILCECKSCGNRQYIFEVEEVGFQIESSSDDDDDVYDEIVFESYEN